MNDEKDKIAVYIVVQARVIFLHKMKDISYFFPLNLH